MTVPSLPHDSHPRGTRPGRRKDVVRDAVVAQAGAVRSGAATPVRVLVVEDDPGDAALIRALLTEAGGYTITHVPRLAQALATLSQGAPELILLDLRLPDCEGIEAVERLHAMAAAIPIVVLTGLDDDALAVRCIDAGAQDYVCKDRMDRDTLHRTLGYALSRHRADLLRRRLEHADRLASLGRLAAGLAHEVANPATSVLAALQHLRDNLIDLREGASPRGEPEPGEWLDDVEALVAVGLEGMRRIRLLLRELGALSRGGLEEYEWVDVRAVVEGSCVLVRNEIRHRASLVQRLGPTPPIVASAVNLGQVAVNLLLNAVHAVEEAPAGDHEIVIETGRDDDGVFIAVEDTGRGMAPEQLERVFEPFFTTRPRGHGTGLGLAISAELVQKHRGEIRARSTPGRGSRFEVRLPFDTGLRAIAAAATTSEDATAARPSASRRLRVLLVDDDAHVRLGLAMLLRREHAVVEADGGEAALRHIAEDPDFDVVVCDLMMPGVDGVSTYEHVCAASPILADRFVFLTGGAFTQRARDFLARNTVTVLEKPIDAERLLATVAAVASSRGTAPDAGPGRQAP